MGVAVDVSADVANLYRTAVQQIVDEGGGVLDAYNAVMVHVANGEVVLVGVAALDEGDDLGVAPLALGVVDIEGLHPIEVRSTGHQLRDVVELVGDVGNQADITLACPAFTY